MKEIRRILTCFLLIFAFAAVADALNEKGFESLSADVGLVPDAYTAVDKETAIKIQKFIDKLEDNDDVQNVYHTAEFPDDFEGVE